MKDHIEQHYPDLPGGRQYSYDQLRGMGCEAWESVTPEMLTEVVGTMRERCQAVIDAQGGHTIY